MRSSSSSSSSHSVDLWIFVLSVICVSLPGSIAAATQIYQAQCRHGLGMQSGAIPDDAISASSSYDEASVGPQNGRIRTEKNGGAWCPRNQISKDVYEWIEVDLGEVKMITVVETQGRFGNGQGQEYAEAYRLEYKRKVDDDHWTRYRDRNGKEVFPGNENTYVEEQREVNPPIVARTIRIVPHSLHQRTICMRLELLGCKWKDGIMSYNMPQGQRRGAEVDLYDFTYDGVVYNDYLSGGLGQLVDGEEGHANFRLDPTGVGRKGYEWIGWKNESLITPPIDIIFEFDVVRNFTSLRIHCNNFFSKDVRVFRKAMVYFSVGGRYFPDNPVVFEYMRDTLIEYARPAIIPIPHRIGRYVKIRLYFDDRWMMISEMQFQSEKATGNVSEEMTNSDTTVFPTDSHGNPRFVHVDLIPGMDDKHTTKKTSDDIEPDSKQPNSLDDKSIGIIVGALAALLLLLLAVVLYVIIRHRRHKYSNGNEKQVEHHVTLNLNDLRAMTNGKVSNGNMYNSIATSELLDTSSHQAMTSSTAPPPLDACQLGNGDMFGGEPNDGIQGRQLPALPPLKTPDSAAEINYNTDTATSREYAVPDVTKSALIGNNAGGLVNPPFHDANMYQDESPPPPPLPPHPRAMFSVAEAMQGFSGNSLYAVPNNMDLLWKEGLSVMEFPRENIKFAEKLGEGQFGEVHLCEAVRVTDFLDDDFLINRTGSSRSIMVAVKILRHDADDQARADFHKEVKIMSKLKDPNIVRVLGVCTQEEPLCMIVEYMKYGDLNQFLQQHVPSESTVARSKHVKAISKGCLIYMATQIASGMKYLETLNMVHRDLATRNCLVGSNYTIKISDFGMSRSLYSSDYYRIEGKAMLPIRWMAWESVLLGKFSSKSDVWSFAVTLWEVLLFAREQPYDHLGDEQVIENCGHYYRNDGQEVVLPQPGNCPKEIYDLMVECWNREEGCRPAFREIHMFLQRKNMGYNPREERQLPTRINVPVV